MAHLENLGLRGSSRELGVPSGDGGSKMPTGHGPRGQGGKGPERQVPHPPTDRV